MEYHEINPFLAKAANILICKTLFPTTEYNKGNLTEKSYIFAPNHTNNWDGYQLWSLLSQDFNLDAFMFREFWDKFPFISKFLPFFNVYPITRSKVVLSELKNELFKLRDENHSLIIFPQGRHVDPEVMLNLSTYHLKTIPLGAFFCSAYSSKTIIPVYLEPQKRFGNNTVVYGNPINPNDYDVLSEDGRVQKRNLYLLAEAWLKEINEAYKMAPILANREMRKYPLHERYTDATGFNYQELDDPNIIASYLSEVQDLMDLSAEKGIDDIYKLGDILGLSPDVIQIIEGVRKTYERSLVRR